jgi:hypothetical protein
VGVAGSPEVLAEVVLGVGGIGYEQREDARPTDLDRGNDDQDDASYQAGLWTDAAPFFSTTCAREEVILRSSLFTRALPMRLGVGFALARRPTP